jgi:hypothetical protein
MREFDVFVSYKSEDHAWVQKLVAGLQRRGVEVWLDRKQIRPGDLFAKALETGLRSSKAVALVVTKASMKSGWVEQEYYRALSLAVAGKLQLIPVIKEVTDVPGFLESRHAVFVTGRSIERQVDTLVWPGLTGKRLLCYGVSAHAKKHPLAWNGLVKTAAAQGIEFAEIEDIHRADLFLKKRHRDPNTRWVVVIDPFEGRPSRDQSLRNSLQEYLDFLMKWRDKTRARANEIVFVLFHKKHAWKKVAEASNISDETRKRLKHYHLLTHEEARQPQAVRRLWDTVQKDALLVWRDPKAGRARA